MRKANRPESDAEGWIGTIRRVDDAERERLERILTPEELAVPGTVERALNSLREMDLHAWEHETAHRLVAGVLGASYEQKVAHEGIASGTAFQVGVIGAAGAEWDRMNGRYLRTSNNDEDCLRAAERVGYDRAFLLYVAGTILGTIVDDVHRIARETLPPGPIQGFSPD
jgi:hypothetical protein